MAGADTGRASPDEIQRAVAEAAQRLAEGKAGIGGGGGGGGGGGAGGPVAAPPASIPSSTPLSGNTAPSMTSGADAGTPVNPNAPAPVSTATTPTSGNTAPAGTVMPASSGAAAQPGAQLGAQPGAQPANVTPTSGGSAPGSPAFTQATAPGAAPGFASAATQAIPHILQPPAATPAATATGGTAAAGDPAQQAVAMQQANQQAQQGGMAGYAHMGISYMTGVGHSMMAVSPSAEMRTLGSVGAAAGGAGLMMGMPLLAGAGALVSGGASILAGGQEFYYSKLMEQAQLERPRYLAGTMGMDLSAGSRIVRQGEELGYKESETAYMMAQLASSVGSTDVGGIQNPLRFQAAGIGVGAQAFYLQSGGVGGGGTRGVEAAQRDLSGLIGTGYQTGLRGERLQELVTRIASIMEGFKEQGLTLNRESSNQLLADAMQSGISPIRAARFEQTLAGETGGLKQQLLAPYRELGQAALMSYAGQTAKSDLEAADIMEQLQQDPQRAYSALRSQGIGQEAIERYFASATGSVREGRILAQGLQRGEVKRAEDIETVDIFGQKFKAFPEKGITPGLAEIAKAEGAVAEEVQKDFIGALREFTAVIKERGLRNVAVGETVGAKSLSERLIEGAGLGLMTPEELTAYNHLYSSGGRGGSLGSR